MQIIDLPKIKPVIGDATKLDRGVVYTWGDGIFLYMTAAEGKSVCLNTGYLVSTEDHTKLSEFRVVKGAFHVEG